MLLLSSSLLCIEDCMNICLMTNSYPDGRDVPSQTSIRMKHGFLGFFRHLCHSADRTIIQTLIVN